MNLESWHSSDDKRQFKIVRTDYMPDAILDHPERYEIKTANEKSGECSLYVSGEDEPRTLCFGPDGIRVVGRGR